MYMQIVEMMTVYSKVTYRNANTMLEVTHTERGNGVQMTFHTSLNHTQVVHICALFGSDVVCIRFNRGMSIQ